MKTVVVDNKLRVRIPAFKPGQVYAWELSGETVKLTPLKPIEDEVPVVKLVRRPDGSFRFPDGVKISRKDIVAAIRADRDSR
ncbi:MAG TPA: hypothetical protein VFB72_02640 [Verrucomicrobiae bacterium]|nr:hypothetical protein [Verrucomicrobiae bacterium]